MRAHPIFLLAVFISLPESLVRGQQVNENAKLLTSAASEPASVERESLPDKPQPVQAGTPGDGSLPNSAAKISPDQSVPLREQQPKRILGMMPNFRAVSPGEISPLPTPKEALWIATQNSFDYSSFLFVGVTSLYSEGTNAHPQLGHGATGYGRYYWRGFIDKTGGNYLVIFAFATVFGQDEQYYAKGQGGFLKRLAYSSSRILITRNYQGKDSVNSSELLGRGMAQGISVAYYPTEARTPDAIASRYAYALLRDAVTNVFREFWPDIATHILHRHT